MRLVLILGRNHGERHFTVISGPEVPYAEQSDRWKGLIVAKGPPELAEIEWWTSDGGRTRTKRFSEPIRPATVDLEKLLSKLSDADLQTLAARKSIDLTGLTERRDFITAIVMTVRLRYLEIESELEPVQPTPQQIPVIPALDAGDDDPGTFSGPSLPALGIVAGTPSS